MNGTGQPNVLPLHRALCSLWQAEKLMKQIGVQNVKLSEYEMSIAAHLVDPLTMQVREGIWLQCSVALEGKHMVNIFLQHLLGDTHCTCGTQTGSCPVLRLPGATLLVWMTSSMNSKTRSYCPSRKDTCLRDPGCFSPLKVKHTPTPTHTHIVYV